MKPAISIIVPVYNAEMYIGNCLDSILEQTFTNFEVIVVNDGSSDKTGYICDEYAQNDSRVKVIHKSYGGVSTARNAGINIAQGDFLGFVDGDDCIDKNMYSELYKLCMETNSDISICKLGRKIDGKLINEDKQEFLLEMDNVEAMRQLFKGVYYRFSLCDKLFNKTCFANIQLPEGRIHEDLSTTYKLFANCNKAVYSSYVGYIYIKRDNSILTSRFNQKRLEAFIAWDEILSFINEKYPQLFNEVVLCFVYWSVDNVFYILNQVENKEDKKRYLFSIQQYIKKYYKNIIKNTSLSLKYKYLIFLLSCNIDLLLISCYLKKLLSRA